MTQAHGSFIWYELMTSDMQAAEAFYCKVVGWTCKEMKLTDIDYRVFSSGEAMTAGLMSIPDEAKKHGARPSWSGVIAVDDIGAAVVKLQKLGGTLIRPPADIPNIGRFAVVTDPQGGHFQILQPAGPPPVNAPPPDAQGRVGWNEFYAIDLNAAVTFYADMFGWTKADVIDMGPMGKYQLFNHGDKTIGGMMQKPPNIPVALWNFYFNAPDFDAATARVTAAGGNIVHGPIQVPGGQWIVQALDPQGALFALVGARA